MWRSLPGCEEWLVRQRKRPHACWRSCVHAGWQPAPHRKRAGIPGCCARGFFARAMLARIRSEGVWTAGDNEPYSVSDGSDYAIPVHAERRGIAHVEIEVRQDLVTDAHGQREWAERIAGWLRGSMADIA